MRVLVSGDRNWIDYDVIFERLAKLPNGTTIVHGAARGADSLGGEAAYHLGFVIERYPANWTKYGRAAGSIRNIQMLDTKPDLVLAFHADLEHSKGTKHCVTEARKRGIPVEVVATNVVL